MTDGIIIITGASGGVGSAATEALASSGHPIVMACRNTQKAELVRDKIARNIQDAEIEIAELHLESFASVREFASKMSERKISALFNNAGVISRGYKICEDGFEESLTVNYLSPVLLTRLLQVNMPDDASIVNMVSLTCDFAKLGGKLFERSEKQFSQLGSYALSKLALLHFSIELSRRVPQRVNVADPGIVDSQMLSMGRWFDPLADILFRPFCNSAAKGARPAINALLSEESGMLFKGQKSHPIPKRHTKKSSISQSLWEETEKILQIL